MMGEPGSHESQKFLVEHQSARGADAAGPEVWEPKPRRRPRLPPRPRIRKIPSPPVSARRLVAVPFDLQVLNGP